MKSEMHNLGYTYSTVTSHCFADFILGKISETSLNIPAFKEFMYTLNDPRTYTCIMNKVPRTKTRM
jgi:hypothetical protein